MLNFGYRRSNNTLAVCVLWNRRYPKLSIQCLTAWKHTYQEYEKYLIMHVILSYHYLVIEYSNIYFNVIIQCFQGMVNGVYGVNGVTSGTAQRRADTEWSTGTATESVTTRNRKTAGKNVQAYSKMKSLKDVFYKSVQVRKFKSW